jgi:hypothetical protein
MNMGGMGGGKVNMKATQQKMKQELRKAEIREQAKKQGELKKMQKELASMMPKEKANTPKYSDEELVAMMETSGNGSMTDNNSQKKKPKKKKNKNKKA